MANVDPEEPIQSPLTASGPCTFLGYRLSELPSHIADNELQGLFAGQLHFEDTYKRVVELFGRFLVFMNGGGVTVGVGVITALISATPRLSPLPVLPGILFFILSLAFCGAGIARAGARLEKEAKESFEDIGRIVRNEMTTTHAAFKRQYRREKIGRRKGMRLLFWSFLLFLTGAFLMPLGLAWPELALYF